MWGFPISFRVSFWDSRPPQPWGSGDHLPSFLRCLCIWISWTWVVVSLTLALTALTMITYPLIPYIKSLPAWKTWNSWCVWSTSGLTHIHYTHNSKSPHIQNGTSIFNWAPCPTDPSPVFLPALENKPPVVACGGGPTGSRGGIWGSDCYLDGFSNLPSWERILFSLPCIVLPSALLSPQLPELPGATSSGVSWKFWGGRQIGSWFSLQQA